MIVEVLAAGLVITACLAIFIDEAIYSVVALTGMFFFTALLYALSGSTLVAVFQFAVGVGTLAILFMSGEMLSEKPLKKTTPKNILAVAILGALLSLPAIFLSFSSPNTTTIGVDFGDALWNLRAADVALQGLVIMAVALGIAIVIYEKKTGGK